MESDGSCRCRPGYEFLINGIKLRDDNGITDCQPLVYQRCSSNQFRNTEGVCVDINDCSQACDGGSGVRSASTGMCQCDSVKPLDNLCNRQCRLALPTATLYDETTMTVTLDGTSATIDLLSYDL
jgi:hypothetical protein